jgi:Skp family chaperone for outer membrane proteins
MSEYWVVDMGRVVMECREGRAAMASLARFLERAGEEKQKLLAEVRKTTGQKKQKARRDLVQFEKRRVRERTRRKRQVVDTMRDAIVEAAAAIAQERGGQPVFDRAALVVFDEGRDITDEVIRRMDS